MLYQLSLAHLICFVRSVSSLFLGLLLACTLSAQIAYAATIPVNDTGDANADDGLCTLREAVIAANTNAVVNGSTGECPAGDPGLDTITLSVGTIQRSANANPITESLIINGLDPAVSFIDGATNYRLIDINGSIAVTITDVTLQNGRVSSGYGAGIFNQNATLFITNTHVISNEVGEGFGGGIHNLGGSVEVVNSYFRNNSAFAGGAINNEPVDGGPAGILTVTTSTLVANLATASTGGAIFNQGGKLLVQQSAFYNNSASSFGGAIAATATNQVVQSLFVGNQAVDGGAISATDGNFTIADSTFYANQATSGVGGAVVYGESSQSNQGGIINTTFFSNTAVFDGGALFASSVTELVLNHLTVVQNSTSGGDGGGLTLDNANTELYNSLISGNLDEEPTATHPDLLDRAGSIAVGNNNLLGDGSGTTLTNGVDGNQIGVSGAQVATNLASNQSLVYAGAPGLGEIVPTLALLENSTAINTAKNASCAPSDERGVVRPQGAGCDIGAYEAVVTPICFTSLDGATTTYQSANSQAVRDAIAAVASGTATTPPNTIHIAGYCAGTVDLDGDPLHELALITQVLTLRGGYTTTNWLSSDLNVNPTTLDALSGGRVITSSMPLTVENLIVQSGLVTAADGGGIFASSDLWLIGSRVRNNRSTGNAFNGYGGGIHVLGATTIVQSDFIANHADAEGGGASLLGGLTISNSQFFSNTANVAGGGVRVIGFAATIDDSLFQDNHVSGNQGGGIYVYQATLYLHNSQLISNFATFAGGGVYVAVGTVTVTRTDFLSNTATGYGGGLYANAGANALVQQSQFIGNRADDEGGALFVLLSNNFRLIANQLLRNQAVEGGGAIYVSGSTLDMVNNLFAQNQSNNNGQDIDIGRENAPSALSGRHNTFVAATPGSGPSIIVGREFISQTAQLSNTIFADYAVGIQTGPNYGSLILDGVLWDNVLTPTQAVSAGLAATITNAWIGDAAFSNPAGDDYRLLPASTAINLGAEVGVTDDFEGQPRPQQGIPDFGYDESPHTLPTIAIGDASVSEGQSGVITLTFPLTLSFAKGVTVTVQFATSDSSGQAGSDYQAASGTVAFAPGQTSLVIAVVVNGDLLIENDEGLRLLLSTPQQATLADAEAAGTIVNDDLLLINLSDGTVSEGNSGSSSMVFTVTLSVSSTLPVTVDYATANGLLPNQAAVAGSDYQASSGTLTFVPGETSKLITVSVTGETLVELDEQFTLTLSNASGVGATIGDDTGAGVIVNDDSTALSIGDVTVAEGNVAEVTIADVSIADVSIAGQGASQPSDQQALDNASFPVTLSNPSALTVTVNYLVVGGTATLSSDLTAASGTLTFAPGTTSQTVNVIINGDLLVENDETFTINLSNPVGATLGKGSGAGVITNDDSTALTISDVSRAEGNSGVTSFVFTVTLSNPSANPVTVSYATSDGSATLPNNDYMASSGLLTFAPLQTRQTLTVTVQGDTVQEANETFTVTLSSPVIATLADGSATGTIVNDDTATALDEGHEPTAIEGGEEPSAMTVRAYLPLLTK